MSAPRNLLTEWARLVAASLASTGVRDVIVSPGSRSTPFVLALRERSEIRLTTIVDERSAAFVALGHARASGRSAAVLCTSGTAAAHWLPAVIEASIARIPLVLLSADRPLTLAHAGAAQTIDQTKLFGGWVRSFVDLGDPRDDDEALAGIPRSIAQLIASAHGPMAGPVHLDLRADKPLEPIEAVTDDERALAARTRRLAERGVARVSFGGAVADETFAHDLAAALGRAKRPLLVAGPRATRDREVIVSSCARLGLTICAEATSGLRFGPRAPVAIDASEVLFSSPRFAEENAPDLVLQIGALPTAPTLERAWRRADRFILDAGGIHDPLGGAKAISISSASATLARTVELFTPGEHGLAWPSRLAEADRVAWSEVERVLASGRGEGALVRAAIGAAPMASIVIGNSLPVRTIDRFVPGGGPARAVYSQRGASGIDGLVSGAIGVALASSAPTLAVVGDLSFLHDTAALASAKLVRSPLVIAVIDNAGGRIFESLPLAARPDLVDALSLFTTPHDVDLSMLARAFGVRCVECEDARGMARAVSSAITVEGATVVRARAEPGEARATFESLRVSVERALFGASS